MHLVAQGCKSFRVAGSCLSIALLSGVLLTGIQANGLAQSVIGAKNEVLVGVLPAMDGAAEEAKLSLFGTIGYHSWDCNNYRLELAPGVSADSIVASLQNEPEVRYAETPRLVVACGSPPTEPIDTGLTIDTTSTDPRYNLPYQYGPQTVQADLAWQLWQPSATINVAIVDTGIFWSHPDLANMISMANGKINGYNSITDPYPNEKQSDGTDDDGHGTECAGIAAAQINGPAAPNSGMAGIAGWNGLSGSSDTTHIKLMPIKALGSTGLGTSVTLGDGLQYAATHGANVISMSWNVYDPKTNLPEDDPYINDWITNAYNKSIVLVAAAGNVGTSDKQYPAYYGDVLSVAASDSSDKLAGFSTYGTWVKVAAPGGQGATLSSPTATEKIWSTGLNSLYVWDWGTSMACPLVAGEAALILAQFPSLANYQVYSLIQNNVDPVTSYIDSQNNTHSIIGGRVNVFKALPSPNTFWQAVAVADIDGDGKSDILFQNRMTGDLSYWLMNGATKKSGAAVSPGNPGDPQWKLVGAGSLSSTGGTPSLTFQYALNGNIAYWNMSYNSGTGVYAQTTSGSFSPNNPGDAHWKLMGMGKFHSGSDHQQDLFFEYFPTVPPGTSNAAAGNQAIWLMSGATQSSAFATTPANAGSSDWLVSGIGDLNADGLSDLVYQQQSTGNLAYWLMSGGTKTSSGSITPANPGDRNWLLVGTGDFDGDGDTDLLFQHRVTGNLAIWYMHGTSQDSGGAVATSPNNPG